MEKTSEIKNTFISASGKVMTMPSAEDTKFCAIPPQFKKAYMEQHTVEPKQPDVSKLSR
ncbi:MAG: hypothetical protein AAF182_04835 [Pseudomonadota bacterium]